MAGFEDYIPDVKKYASKEVNELAVRKIVNHCGIALQHRDSSLVAATDAQELLTVRESWLKKKLALTASDADLDQAINEVMLQMKGNNAKSRVTVYYLLAEKLAKIDDLVA